jgi:general secretion pathway protein I
VTRGCGARRSCGFTLIEVLVALAVAAIGLAAVLSIVTNTANAAAGVRERTFAAWIANNRIVETRISDTFPSVDRTSGDVEFAGQRWFWEQTVTQTDVPGIRRLDVRVRRADGPEDAYLANVTGFVGRSQMTAPPAAISWDAQPGQGGQPGQPAPPGQPGQQVPPGQNPGTIVVPGVTP